MSAHTPDTPPRASAAQRLASTAMAICLAVMATSVFINVVLRYGFGSGVAVWIYAIGLMLLACVAPIIAAGVWAVFRRHAYLE